MCLPLKFKNIHVFFQRVFGWKFQHYRIVLENFSKLKFVCDPLNDIRNAFSVLYFLKSNFNFINRTLWAKFVWILKWNFRSNKNLLFLFSFNMESNPIYEFCYSRVNSRKSRFSTTISKWDKAYLKPTKLS